MHSTQSTQRLLRHSRPSHTELEGPQASDMATYYAKLTKIFTFSDSYRYNGHSSAADSSRLKDDEIIGHGVMKAIARSSSQHIVRGY